MYRNDLVQPWTVSGTVLWVLVVKWLTIHLLVQ